MAMKIKTLKDFVLECVKRPGEEADIFEDECTQSLRTQIYSLAGDDTPEPFRSAMFIIGFTDY